MPAPTSPKSPKAPTRHFVESIKFADGVTIEDAGAIEVLYSGDRPLSKQRGPGVYERQIRLHVTKLKKDVIADIEGAPCNIPTCYCAWKLTNVRDA